MSAGQFQLNHLTLMPLLRTAHHAQEIIPAPPSPAARTGAKTHAARLGWRLQAEDEGQLIFGTRTSWRSWGEVVTVNLRESRLRIESRCRWSTQVFDWGKNRRNCEALAAGVMAGHLSRPQAS